MHASVRNQADHAAFAGHAVDAHLHARVHGADEHVDFVALHQFVGVFNGFGGIGLVVHFEPLDFAATQFAALFVDGHAHAVFDGHAQLGKGAGVGQHQADTDFAALGQCALRHQQAGRSGAQEGSTLRQQLAARL